MKEERKKEKKREGEERESGVICNRKQSIMIQKIIYFQSKKNKIKYNLF